jgi:hypothetical protein
MESTPHGARRNSKAMKLDKLIALDTNNSDKGIRNIQNVRESALSTEEHPHKINKESHGRTSLQDEIDDELAKNKSKESQKDLGSPTSVLKKGKFGEKKEVDNGSGTSKLVSPKAEDLLSMLDNDQSTLIKGRSSQKLERKSSGSFSEKR